MQGNSEAQGNEATDGGRMQEGAEIPEGAVAKPSPTLPIQPVEREDTEGSGREQELREKIAAEMGQRVTRCPGDHAQDQEAQRKCDKQRGSIGHDGQCHIWMPGL
jgi:hypothetical protein